MGVAFLNSFANGGPDDNAYWVFATGFDQSFGGGSSGTLTATALEQANTAAHEGGHTLGLLHYGANNPQTNAIMQTPDTGLNMEAWRAGHDQGR